MTHACADLEHLVRVGRLDVDWQSLLVEEMNDGGMGSLLLYPRPTTSHRRFGRQAADCRFLDADGIDVIASLNLDEEGELFELDVWKVSYAPLIRIAEQFAPVGTIEAK